MMWLQRLTRSLKGLSGLFRRRKGLRASDRDVATLHGSVSLVLQSLSNHNAVAREGRRLYTAAEQRLNAVEQRNTATDAIMARLEQRIDRLAKQVGALEQHGEIKDSQPPRIPDKSKP